MAWGRGRRRGEAWARGMDLPGRPGDRRRWLARVHADEDQSELGPLAPADLRWDYLFLNWPSGPGGVGHPLHSSWHRGRRGGPRGAARGV